MHTLKNSSRARMWLIVAVIAVAIVAIWTLLTPHPLRDTDQFGYARNDSGLLQAMDNMMLGAFMAPATPGQDAMWQTYQNGPMTIRYRSGQNGFDTTFTNLSNRNHSMMYGYGYGDPIGGAFIMLLFWALIITGAVMIIRYFMHGPSCHVCGRNHHHGHGHGHSALDILAERYARGEIEKDEYEAKKKDILS